MMHKRQILWSALLVGGVFAFGIITAALSVA
jgi:hypothetical protein